MNGAWGASPKASRGAPLPGWTRRRAASVRLGSPASRASRKTRARRGCRLSTPAARPRASLSPTAVVPVARSRSASARSPARSSSREQAARSLTSWPTHAPKARAGTRPCRWPSSRCAWALTQPGARSPGPRSHSAPPAERASLRPAAAPRARPTMRPRRTATVALAIQRSRSTSRLPTRSRSGAMGAVGREGVVRAGPPRSAERGGPVGVPQRGDQLGSQKISSPVTPSRRWRVKRPTSFTEPSSLLIVRSKMIV